LTNTLLEECVLSIITKEDFFGDQVLFNGITVEANHKKNALISRIIVE
jgi:hypothetical protein